MNIMVIKVKKKASNKISANKTTIDNLVIEIQSIKQQKKLLEQREKELIDRVTPYVEKTVSQDSSKNYNYRVVSPTGEIIVFQRQARKKISLNHERAIRILKARKLFDAIYITEKIAPEVTEDQLIDAIIKAKMQAYLDTVEVVDEGVLEQLLLNEEINQEDFEEMCDMDITYATLCFVEKEE